jgi:membrane-bound lytic murein transglycosylase F
MMLTEHTADKMGVKNRLDPKQSIMAGAQYFLLLKNEIPARIAEPDRTWLALASYNVGIAHLEDARVLTQRMGLNPDVWADVKKALPLLTQFQHYSKLKNGFARGGAAVIFVESIRTYYDILVKYEAKNTITPPPVKPSKINVAWAELRAMAIP